MKIHNLIQTCELCPSQWEGNLEDGRMVYVRYRWGRLSVMASHEPSDDVDDALEGEEIFRKCLDEEAWDGVLDQDKMLETAGMEVEDGGQ